MKNRPRWKDGPLRDGSDPTQGPREMHNHNLNDMDSRQDAVAAIKARFRKLTAQSRDP
jgi:hypothetical protein